MVTASRSGGDSDNEGIPGGDERGFTLIELLIVVVLLGIVLAIGAQGLRQFNETAVVDRAARAIASDVTLVRSHAIQRGNEVALIADEGARTYVIRDEVTMDTLLVRSFSGSSDLPLTTLDITNPAGGDGFSFNARGLTTNSGVVEIDLERLGSEKKIEINAMGRTRISTP